LRDDIFQKSPLGAYFRIGESQCFALLVAQSPFRISIFAKSAELPWEPVAMRKPFRQS
jgi:hypothetical protein